MNVLVYSGPGVSPVSLSHTLSTLRSILFPNYVVQPVTAEVLVNQPWSTSCALLVIPGGRDLPFLSSLSPAITSIKNYVREGGLYLGLCAGAYFASKRVEWEVGTSIEVSGNRPLAFFGGTCKGCVYPGFRYDTEEGAKAVRIELTLGQQKDVLSGLYYNGGGEFVGAERLPDTQILAKYLDGEGNGKTAGVLCTVGLGKALLWGIHPEYPLTLEPARSAILREVPSLGIPEELESNRWRLFKSTLSALGLHLPVHNSQVTGQTLPLFLVGNPQNHGIVPTVMDALSQRRLPENDGMLLDSNDTFQFHDIHSSEELISKFRSGEKHVADSNQHIIVCDDGSLPSTDSTPLFAIKSYFQHLSDIRPKHLLPRSPWPIGDALLYGESVSSTQTILDKNNKLLSSLPDPLLFIATIQTAGRGRGGNAWLSPLGCLQFSIFLKLRLSSIPASKIVFVQYLVGLAVVQACRSPHVLGSLGEQVRLKWPNDIYAVVNETEKKKIGGILVNTSFQGNEVRLVVGVGLNVLNPPPITSLSQLLPPGVGGVDLSMERTAAAVMSSFESMWTQFLASRGSFEGFIEQYLDCWLHSDQLVTLTTVDPPLNVRIVGITPDHGLLRTIPEVGIGAGFIDLQPDGNSFDMMAGLIRTKT